MPSDLLKPLTAELRALGGQRVWSLMISLFGDLAQGKDDKIDGPVLSAIMAALDIKPEATRVALHRLRNDGWIKSEKSGRISKHSLTPQGQAESAAASPRIYANPVDGPSAWQMVLVENAEQGLQLALSDHIQLAPQTFVGPQSTNQPQNALVLPGGDAPDWLKRKLVPRHLLKDYGKLLLALTELAIQLPAPLDLGPLDTAVLRCLVVHNWRRLVLKHQRPPQALITIDLPSHQCHLAVADLLARFKRPSLDEIGQEQARHRRQ